MADRKKLIELLRSDMNVLKAAGTSATATLRLADNLIENGIIVPPCKIGDTLYDIFEALNNGDDEIKEFKVSKIQIDIMRNGRAFLVVENTMFPLDDFGKTIFPTREEAKAVLAKMDEERSVDND